ncbi:MAG: Uma2 family endonuclease [Planctomycetota bacterium]|nr:MAG: Uma2 family endonuclease [Planctomycetota bacterium]REJ97728.1 MAG: Uma2 family endonuclease [Planctomycetota bacterium]REK26658.1 MAG: Uma2 family endonuclease [Planctomycetota bacterium]REK35683.1 MAG: Uma2 family endonuclease [Planctomycetota bacterium]
MSTATSVTIDQFERMIDRGAFTGRSEQRVELIRAELRSMSPIGVDHENIVDWLLEWSFDNVDRKTVRIRCQESIGISKLETIPQPDIAWVSRKNVRGRPAPEDVLLLIEVADSSLGFDSGEKARIYAEAGIRDYWIVNIPQRRLIVLREPGNDGYASRIEHAAGAVVSPALVSASALMVTELFSCLEGHGS